MMLSFIKPLKYVTDITYMTDITLKYMADIESAFY